MLNKIFNCIDNLNYTYERITNLDYPLVEYYLYEFTIRGFNCSITDSMLMHFRIKSQIPNDKYLVAIKKNGMEIKYLSGAFFKNRIKEDFNLNINAPESYLNYLYIKGYNYDLQNIIFKKREKTNLIFEAYSKSLNSNVKISIPFNDQEVVTFSPKEASR